MIASPTTSRCPQRVRSTPRLPSPGPAREPWRPHSRAIGPTDTARVAPPDFADRSRAFVRERMPGLDDEAPLETYGRADRALSDPYVTPFCPDGQTPSRDESKRRPRVTCPGGGVAWAKLEIERAIANDDHRAQQVCAARKYLYERLDDRGRELFADAARRCKIATAPPNL